MSSSVDPVFDPSDAKLTMVGASGALASTATLLVSGVVVAFPAASVAVTETLRLVPGLRVPDTIA